ncbi:hypothetical protein HAX54_022359, partial [Datura stramonium]|nr:hypothetical protein [Datura stramonium]
SAEYASIWEKLVTVVWRRGSLSTQITMTSEPTLATKCGEQCLLDKTKEKVYRPPTQAEKGSDWAQLCQQPHQFPEAIKCDLVPNGWLMKEKKEFYANWDPTLRNHTVKIQGQ